MKNSDMPAFPVDTNMCGQLGITKREYFALMAMQGMLSNRISGEIEISYMSIKYADELLKQLEK